MTKNIVIKSGTVSGKGNVTGYSALGDKVFIHKALLESLQIKDAASFSKALPFFAIVGVKQVPVGEYNDANKFVATLDEDGTPKTEPRVQALSIFKTKEEMLAAHTESFTLEAEVRKAVKGSAEAAGLSETEVAALMSMA